MLFMLFFPKKVDKIIFGLTKSLVNSIQYSSYTSVTDEKNNRV
jgi:hypothetical protein